MSGRRLTFARAGLEHLSAMRDAVASVCAEAGAPAEVAETLALAVDEVCTNVIVHGYEGAEPGPLTLTTSAADGLVVLTVTDAGRPFDPGAAPRPDIDAGWEERGIGGLGWHLVRSVVDEVRYERRGDENEVTLIKRLDDGGPHESRRDGHSTGGE